MQQVYIYKRFLSISQLIFIDRAHVDDVEKEMDEYVKQMEEYINAIKSEIKARNHLISLLFQAENQLDKDKKDVKLVASVRYIFDMTKF